MRHLVNVMVVITGACTGTSSEGMYHETVSGQCIFLGLETTDFYTARNYCLDRQGDLLKLNNITMHEEVTSFLKDESPLGVPYTWVGVVRRYLQWTSGRQTVIRLLCTKF